MMFGELFFTLLPFVPASMLVLFLFVVIHVMYRALYLPPGFDREHDGHCAACGYVLGTLGENRCPECGVDLLKAGVLTRRMYMQLRGSSVGAISAWTVLVFSVGGVGLAIWGSVVQTNYWMSNAMGGGIGATYTQIVTYGPEVEWDDDTRSIQGQGFEVRFEMPMDAMSQVLVEPLSVVLELSDGQEFTLVVEEDGAWVLSDADEAELGSGDSLDAGVIDRLFATGGFDVESDEYRAYSGQIFVLADVARVDGAGGLRSEGSIKLMKVQEASGYEYSLSQQGWTNNSTPTVTGFGASAGGGIPYAMWSPVLYGLIGLVVLYLIGIVIILRRRRRVLAIGRYTLAADEA